MSWIQTYVGHQFWPLAPRAEDLDILDIAHSLSLQCRFNGHCRVFYSVADHSVRVAEQLPDDLALWGLLHDAAEAYLGDLSRPLKRQDEARWFNDAEDRLLQLITETYGLQWPMPVQVRAADDVLLVTEARDLMVEPPADWSLEAQPLTERIEPREPAAAEALFLERYEALRVRG